MILHSFAQLNAVTGAQQPVLFINKQQDLQLCLNDLAGQSSIAFDLEFDNNLRSYGVTLCLIQVATPATCYVIDPFASIDLKGLYTLFEDERIQKLVHSPGEDLRLLHSLYCYPKNLFDTEIPARLLNYEQTSLAVMLQEKLGVVMSKQHQKSNWLQRPLSTEQIRYAANDVAWLHALKQKLEEEAQQKGLLAYVMEEQAGLSTTIYKTEIKTWFLKPADVFSLSPKEQFILNALFQFRDGLAKKMNKPPFQVIDEEVLRSLASGKLKAADLVNTKGIHHQCRTPEFAAALTTQLKEINAAAQDQDLSDELPKREWLPAEAIAQREKANKDRNQKFVPVQQALATQFGVFAARFILSNTSVNEVLSGKMTIGNLKPYRQQLIYTAAEKAGINLSDYA